jgi:hypothetical protein
MPAPMIGIGQPPAGEHDDQGGDDDAERPQHVAHDLEIGALYVQAFARTGGKQLHAA